MNEEILALSGSHSDQSLGFCWFHLNQVGVQQSRHMSMAGLSRRAASDTNNLRPWASLGFGSGFTEALLGKAALMDSQHLAMIQ